MCLCIEWSAGCKCCIPPLTTTTSLLSSFSFPPQEVVKLVHDADPNQKVTGDGFVDFNVFLDIMGDKYSERDPNDEIRKAFELFDDDRTGGGRKPPLCHFVDCHITTSHNSRRRDGISQLL